MMRVHRSFSVGLALLWLGATAVGHGQQPAAGEIQREIETLVAQLYPSQTRAVGWSVTARLQQLGADAAEALAAHLPSDPFLDRDHGNHSLTMEALAKIGPQAVDAVDRLLTPALLQSVDRVDRRTALSVTMVLSRIGPKAAAAQLVRVARDASDPQVRASALDGLGVWERYPPSDVPIPSGAAETCLGRHWSECPFDSRSRQLADAVAPVLGDVGDLLQRESDPQVVHAAAVALTRWSDGDLKRIGEDALAALAGRADAAYASGLAIRSLGELGVVRARDIIRTRAASAADDETKRTAAEALARLGDPAHVTHVVELMTSPSGYPRQWALALAGRSRSVAFVPGLIERLEDGTPTGRTRSRTVDGRTVEEVRTVGDDALAALRALTFRDFGRDPEPWRAWWGENRDRGWQAHLNDHIARILPQMPSAEPWVLNEWMDRLETAADPAVLPFVAAYLRHPKLRIGATGPNSFRGGGGPPVVVTLLLELVGAGVEDARRLLYECLETTHYPLNVECPRAVATFDAPRAAERLTALLDGPSWMWAAETLLQLGDARPVPTLIDILDRATGFGTMAIRLLRSYTQQDIPYDPDASLEARKDAADEWRAWWAAARGNVALNRRAARVDLECCRF